MLHKDRYSQAFLFLLTAGAFSLYLFRDEKEFWASVIMASSIVPTAYLMARPARVHMPNETKQNTDIEYKGENDCGFSKAYTKQIDGLRIKGVRYKFVNGTDACVSDDLSVKPCFLGSRIMQRIANAGEEPPKIQGDACWE